MINNPNQIQQELRLFYAIELPDQLKRKIQLYINYLKDVHDKIKWVSHNNLHLTLKFLGNVNLSELGSFIKLIETVSVIEKPFIYSLSGIGCFPNINRPNVIWIGAKDGVDQLTKIAGAIESNLIDIGFGDTEGRGFKPHITIGRFKDRSSASISQNLRSLIINDNDKQFGEFTVKSISLIKSVLTSDGPIYTTIFKSSL